MKRKISIIIALSFFLFVLFPMVSVAYADEVSIPISYSANEAVTAADVNFIIYNGSIVSVTCGDEFSGYEELITREAGCVVFHSSGGSKTGTIATIVVETIDPDLLSVDIEG